MAQLGEAGRPRVIAHALVQYGVESTRRWAAIGVAMVLPWIWLVVLDHLLRRKR